MAARTSVPILLLTGFLGSGKTALLARWLRDRECAATIPLINEIGAVGLDDRLARTALDAPAMLEGACVCCDGGDDLAGALESLFWDRLHRRIPPFDRVIVETTGLADPGPILDLISSRAIVFERYHIEAVVTALDARLGPAQLAEFAECRAQIAAASLAIVTKCDLASEAEQSAALAAIAANRPDLPALCSRGADIAMADVCAAIADVAPSHVQQGTPAAHTPAVSTAFEDMPAPVDPDQLKSIIAAALADFGGKVLRIKGLVRAAPGADWLVVQVAPDHAVRLAPLSDNAVGARAGLTIIARDIPAAVVAARLRARLAPLAEARAHAV